MSIISSDKPFIKTPVNRWANEVLQYGCRSQRCGHFEYRLMECMESYGGELHEKSKCWDYYKDLQECLFAKKTICRIQAMRKERNLQYKEGRLEQKYMDKPFPNIL